MTTDERLEKLVERHESLSHAVELVAAMQKQTENEIQNTQRQMRNLSRIVHHYRRRS